MGNIHTDTDHEHLDDDLRYFWAKSNKEATGTLSVLQHAADTSGIISYVAERLIAPSTLQLLEKSFEPVPLLTVLQFAAWSHDVGKISAYFSPKVPALHHRVSRRGYRADHITPVMLSSHPHTLVGADAIKSWLQPSLNRRALRKTGWINVIGGHHGTFPENGWSRRFLESIEEENWKSARRSFLDAGTKHLALTSSEVERLKAVQWTAQSQVLVTGLIIASDWVASNEYFFPYDTESYDDSRIGHKERQERAKSRVSFGGVWKPTSDMSDKNFVRRFSLPDGGTPRNIQRTGIDVAQKQMHPGLHVIESETGSGKTETALAMADILAEKFGFNGVYFAQPTRVTSDAMFDRVAQWLSNTDVTDDSISMILAHGKAELNDSYQEISRNGVPTSIFDEDQNRQTIIEAHSWFRGRKTGLLAPIVVGTIDQLLFAALRSKHLALRHLGLSNKVVIIDEVHAADAYMRVYLKRILEWLGSYGVPVIALSATQPPQIREELLSAYWNGATGPATLELNEPIDSSNRYPRITTVDESGITEDFPRSDGNARDVNIEFLPGSIDQIAEAVVGNAQTDGCIAVICDTVSRAQHLYDIIAEQLDDVVLLHSRFLTSDRMKLEATLVKKLGRHGEDRPRRLVVVSTQILEQGLDIDFDLMYSDAAPVDLLIQRIGRLHRHPELMQLRPDDKKTARFIVTGSDVPNPGSTGPSFPKGIVSVYRLAPLLRTTAVLAEHLQTSFGTIRIPDDVASLVNRAYDPELEAPKEWREEWVKAEAKEDEFLWMQKQSAEEFCIGPPFSSDTLETWSGGMSIAEEARGVAQVRDADESFEVIVVQRRDGRIYPLPGQEHEDMPVDGTVEIDNLIAKSLARCTVRLPGWVVKDEDLFEMESDGQESWQASPWLKGQLPLVLNDRFERELSTVLLAYDYELGLLIERKTNS